MKQTSINDIKLLLKKLIYYQHNIKCIRVGGLHDGGYIIPEVENISAVISAGIADNIKFDSYFASRNIKVFQYDPTIDSPPDSPFKNYFVFSKQTFGSYYNVRGLNFDDIFQKHELYKLNDHIIAKFDVEGGEFDALLSSNDETLKKMSIITGEFHDINNINDPAIYERLYKTLDKLLNHFFISHLCVNNHITIKLIHGMVLPYAIEITFLNKSMFKHSNLINTSGRNSLDSENNPNLPFIQWNPAWYI